MKCMETTTNRCALTVDFGVGLKCFTCFILFNFFDNPWNKHCVQNKKEIKEGKWFACGDVTDELCSGFKSSNLNLCNSRTRALSKLLLYLPPCRKCTGFRMWFGLCYLLDTCSWLGYLEPLFSYVFKNRDWWGTWMA